MKDRTIWRVTFHVGPQGLIYDPREPIHLDGLIAWAGAFRYPPGPPPRRGDPIEEQPLPVVKQRVNGVEVFRASALFPDGPEVWRTAYIRKRYRFDRAHGMTRGTVNYSSGPAREHNIPLAVLHVPRMVGWFHGRRRDVTKWFRALRAIGRKRELGYGAVTHIEIEPSDEDRCVAWEGRAMRFYPHPAGLKLVRPRPPYWNVTERVKCLMPGEVIPE